MTRDTSCLPCRFMQLRVSIPVYSKRLPVEIQAQLQQMQPVPKTKFYTLDSMCIDAEAIFNITVTQLKSPTRTREVSEIRMMIFYIAYHMGCNSYQRIGEYFNRDHSTVIYGVRQCDILRGNDKSYLKKYKQLYGYITQSPELKIS